jgi:hypothetical protein
VLRLSSAILVALPVLALAPRAPAAAPDPAKLETDAARDLFRQGRDLYKKNQIAEAHDKFLAAWGIKKHWQIALNLGATEMLLQHYREAADHLTWADRESAGSPEDDDIRWLRTQLPEVRRKVASVSFRGDAGLDVHLDDKPLGTTPLADELFLDPGPHDISADAAGKPATRIHIELAAGESREIALTSPADPAPPIADNVPPLPEETGLEARTVVLLTGGVLSAVGIGLGIYFSVRSSSSDSDAANLRARVAEGLAGPGGGADCTVPSMLCDDLSRAVHDRATAAQRARVAFVAGGALAAVTAGTWLLWPRRDSRSARRSWTIEAAVQGPSVWVHGSF